VLGGPFIPLLERSEDVRNMLWSGESSDYPLRVNSRGIQQKGSAGWGPRGRGFKSRLPDQPLQPAHLRIRGALW